MLFLVLQISFFETDKNMTIKQDMYSRKDLSALFKLQVKKNKRYIMIAKVMETVIIKGLSAQFMTVSHPSFF